MDTSMVMPHTAEWRPLPELGKWIIATLVGGALIGMASASQRGRVRS